MTGSRKTPSSSTRKGRKLTEGNFCDAPGLLLAHTSLEPPLVRLVTQGLAVDCEDRDVQNAVAALLAAMPRKAASALVAALGPQPPYLAHLTSIGGPAWLTPRLLVLAAKRCGMSMRQLERYAAEPGQHPAEVARLRVGACLLWALASTSCSAVVAKRKRRLGRV